MRTKEKGVVYKTLSSHPAAAADDFPRRERRDTIIIYYILYYYSLVVVDINATERVGRTRRIERRRGCTQSHRGIMLY